MTMLALKVAHNYAKALVEVAVKRGMLDEVERALMLVRNLMEMDPRIRRALVETWDSVKEKEEAIEEALRGQMPDIVVNFLLAVVRRKREELLPLIFREFERLAVRERGKVPVELRVPMPPSSEDLRAVEGALRELLGREPEVEVKVDPNLIGGAMVAIDSRVFDLTISRLLGRMTRRLIRPEEG